MLANSARRIWLRRRRSSSCPLWADPLRVKVMTLSSALLDPGAVPRCRVELCCAVAQVPTTRPDAQAWGGQGEDMPGPFGRAGEQRESRRATPELDRRRCSWPIGSIQSTKGRAMVKAVVLYGPPEDRTPARCSPVSTTPSTAGSGSGAGRSDGSALGSRRRARARSPHSLVRASRASTRP